MPKTTEVVERETPSLYFDFPKESKKMPVPEHFDDLEVDKEVSVVVKGIVRSISHDSHSRSFKLEPSKVQIRIKEEKPKSLQEAMSENKEQRKFE